MPPAAPVSSFLLHETTFPNNTNPSLNPTFRPLAHFEKCRYREPECRVASNCARNGSEMPSLGKILQFLTYLITLFFQDEFSYKILLQRVWIKRPVLLELLDLLAYPAVFGLLYAPENLFCFIENLCLFFSPVKALPQVSRSPIGTMMNCAQK